MRSLLFLVAAARCVESEESLLRLGALVPFSVTDTSSGSVVTGQYADGRFRSIAAAAIEASRHFNARNGSVVPALGAIDASCDARIEMSTWDTFANARGAIEACGARR
jgi:hypothetical protein